MKGESKIIYILCVLTIIILGLSGAAEIFSAEEPIVIEEIVNENPVIDNNTENIVDVVEENQEIVEVIPESLNGLLIGFDASNGLTDVMMVGSLDTTTNKVKIISVPRDLYINFREEKYNHIKLNNPNSVVIACKLNEVYSYSGWDDHALQDVKELVSIITGLEIDYMATINIEGFEQVVDAVGGVEFDVPQDMYYYDPAADFLIDLDEGLQILDGDKALQLVRYRKYTMADLQRIKVQQDFLIAMYHEIIQDLNMDEALELTKIAYDIVETDFGLFDTLEYAQYLLKLDTNQILSEENMMTIPSYGEKIDGIWYQFIDEEEKEIALGEFLSVE